MSPVNYSDLSPANVAMLLGLLIPILVSLLAKENVSNGVKIVLNLVLTAAASVVGTLVAPDGSHFTWTTFVISWIAAFLTSTLAYLGVYKPAGISGGITSATPNFGVGSSGAPYVGVPIQDSAFAPGPVDLTPVPVNDPVDPAPVIDPVLAPVPAPADVAPVVLPVAAPVSEPVTPADS